MELRRLTLSNIRSYERAELALPSGTTLIAGDVGAGKTSLLYAVEMALFGFAAVDAPFLIRHGAVHAEVSAMLEGDGHRYEVSRRFRRVQRRGRDSFEIERLTFAQDGARTVYSATELRQRVIDLFGFPDNPNPRSHSDLWRWAVYVPQEQMREVLSQDPQERLQTVRRALGVERYRLAADNAQDVASEVRQLVRIRREESDRLSHWESELVVRGEDLDRAEVRTAEATKAISASEAALKETRSLLERAEEDLRTAEGDRREREGLKREQDRDRAQAATVGAARAAVEAELAREARPAETAGPSLDERIEDLQATTRRLEQERETIERSRTEIETRVRALIQAETDHVALERIVAERTEERSLAVEEIRAAQAEIDRTVSEGPTREPAEPTQRSLTEIDGLTTRAREAEREAQGEEVRAQKELEEIERLLEAGECPRCHQPVRAADFAPHRTDAAQELERAAARARASTTLVGRWEEERRARERFERAHERWLEVERRRASAREARDAAADHLARAEDALTRAHLEQEAGRVRVASLAPARPEEAEARARSGRVEGDLKQAHRHLEEARAQLQAIRDATHLRERLVADRERLQVELDGIRGRIAEREERLGVLERSVRRLPGVVEAAREAREQNEEARRELEERRVDHARAQQDAAIARQQRHEAEKGVEERARLLLEVRALENKAAWLGGPFHEAVLAMERRILAQAQATFQRDFSRYFRALIDDPLLEARVGAGFDPTVLIGGAWTPPEALSGGERTSLALAFRLALGQVVRTLGSLKLDTLILDEPTDGFSPEQIVRMGELLRSLGLPQVILVSHEMQLSSVADHVVQAVKNHGRSEIRAIGGAGSTSGEADSEGAGPGSPRRRRRTPAKSDGGTGQSDRGP